MRRPWNFLLPVFALGAAFGVLGMLVAPRVSLPDHIWPATRSASAPQATDPRPGRARRLARPQHGRGRAARAAHRRHPGRPHRLRGGDRRGRCRRLPRRRGCPRQAAQHPERADGALGRGPLPRRRPALPAGGAAGLPVCRAPHRWLRARCWRWARPSWPAPGRCAPAAATEPGSAGSTPPPYPPSSRRGRPSAAPARWWCRAPSGAPSPHPAPRPPAPRWRRARSRS